MESNTTTSQPQSPDRTSKLCTSVVFCFLTSILLAGLLIVLFKIFEWAGRNRSLGIKLLGYLFLLAYLASFVLAYVVAPILGIRLIRHLRTLSSGPDARIKTKLLIISSLFSSACVIPVALALWAETPLSMWMGLWLTVPATLGLLTGWACLRDSQTRGIRLAAICAALIGLAGVPASLWATNAGRYIESRFEYDRKAPTVSGTSEQLEHTTIVPTLDSPIPGDNNVIWCSSFQLAWNCIKDDVLDSPLQVKGAEALADLLNTAPQSDSDLDARSFYATAGRIKEGIVKRIQQDMASQFPTHTLPDFVNNATRLPPEGILAYAFIKASVPFTHPFRHVTEEFLFQDRQGHETPVEAFGVWDADPAYEAIFEQVEVLYMDRAPDERGNISTEVKECALDLCKYSTPYQVIVAMVEPRDSLAHTMAYVQERIIASKHAPQYPETGHLSRSDTLMVPDMFWKIDHRFHELIGKVVTNANPAMSIVEAMQCIEFRLDRCGAILESESGIGLASTPAHYTFNRPFLVYLKHRQSDQPFFVMWVDNAELLTMK